MSDDDDATVTPTSTLSKEYQKLFSYAQMINILDQYTEYEVTKYMTRPWQSNIILFRKKN